MQNQNEPKSTGRCNAVSNPNSPTVRLRIIEGTEARALTRDARWKLLSPYVMQHGCGCLGYATLQDGLDYFIVEGKGYIASKTVGRIRPTTLVLGDPICHGLQLPGMLDEFSRIYADPVFLCISRRTALELAERGFFVNHCGIETWINIQTWNTDGTKKQKLRTALNQVAKAGITITEFTFGQVHADEVRMISREWLEFKTKRDGEMTFLTPPPVYDDEPFVRKFCARNGQDLLGFVIFLPLFERGKVVGFVSTLLRARRETPRGLLSAIQCCAFEQFKKEGIEKISLGPSPLFRIEDAEGISSPFTTVILTALFQSGRSFYSFRGLAGNKREFRGEERHVYIATRHKHPILPLYRSFVACNIHPIRQFFAARLQRERSTGCCSS